MICKKYPFALQHSIDQPDTWTVIKASRVIWNPSENMELSIVGPCIDLDSHDLEEYDGCDHWTMDRDTWRVRFYETLEDLVENNLGVIL